MKSIFSNKWRLEIWLAIIAWSGLVIGIVANTIVVIITIPFFFNIPIGAEIRPMGWAGISFLIALGSIILGLPCSLVGILSKRRLIGWISLVLVLSPELMASGLLHIAAAMCRFTLLP